MSDENALDAHIRLSVLKAVRIRGVRDEADAPVEVEREPKAVDVCTFMELLEKEGPKMEEEKPPKRRYVVTPHRKPDWMKNKKLLPKKPPTKSGRPWEPDR